MTSKYIVMLEQPLFVNKTATNGVSLHHHLKWKPQLPVSRVNKGGSSRTSARNRLGRMSCRAYYLATN